MPKVERRGAGGEPKVKVNATGQAQTMFTNDPRDTDEEALIETDLNGNIMDDPSRIVPPGTGKRFVVLHQILSTPTGAYTRGQVISESHLQRKERDTRGHATGKPVPVDERTWKRLLNPQNPALREATAEESKAGFVDIPLDEDAAKLQHQQALSADSQAEVERLRAELEEANRRAEEAELKLQQQNVVGGSTGGAGTGGQGAASTGTGTGGTGTATGQGTGNQPPVR